MFWWEHYDLTRTYGSISADDCQTCAAHVAKLIDYTDKAAEASVTAYHWERRGAVCEERGRGRRRANWHTQTGRVSALGQGHWHGFYSY